MTNDMNLAKQYYKDQYFQPLEGCMSQCVSLSTHPIPYQVKKEYFKRILQLQTLVNGNQRNATSVH